MPNMNNLAKKTNFLVSLSPQLLGRVLCKLPISTVVSIRSTSKQVRDKVDDNVVWAELFVAQFPKEIANVNENSTWKDRYKTCYKQLLHPLSIELSIEPTSVALGDAVTITFKLINHRDTPLTVLLGYNYSEFQSASILRTKQTLGRRKGDAKIVPPRHTGGGLCGTFAKSIPTTIDKETTLSVAATVTKNQNQVGLLINDYLGYFLPLIEPENKVWVFFKSTGVYREFNSPVEIKHVEGQYWKGTVISNSFIMKVQPQDTNDTNDCNTTQQPTKLIFPLPTTTSKAPATPSPGSAKKQATKA